MKTKLRETAILVVRCYCAVIILCGISPYVSSIFHLIVKPAIASEGVCTDNNDDGYCDNDGKTRCSKNVNSGKCHVMPE